MNRNLGKIFVTGADGFIGSHLVETLISQQYEVTALCLYNSFGKYGWLEKISQQKLKNLNLILGDIRDSYFIKNVLKDHNTVFHLAALISIPYSYFAPRSYFETNILGTINLMEACLQNKVSRFIHTSTSEVYGTALYTPINEKHPLQGQSPYSASKIGADMAVESFYRSMDLPCVTLRPFNTYGPRQSLRAVIPTIISQAINHSSSIKLGNLNSTRDFNYVLDTVEAFIAVAKGKDDLVHGQVFNTGTGQEISIQNLVHLISRILNVEINIENDENRIRPANSEVERLISDAAKLKNTLNWEPKFNLENGLTHLIEWMRQQNNYLIKSDQYYR